MTKYLGLWACGFALIFGLPLYFSSAALSVPVALLIHAALIGFFLLLVRRFGRARTFEMGISVFVLSIIVSVLIAGWQSATIKTYDGQPISNAAPK